MKRSTEDGVVAGFGCLMILVWAGFWITVIGVVIHFVAKWW